MPSDSTTQFVTAVKLQELRAQHTRLRVAYDRLTAEAAAGADPYQRLMHLYRGLADLTYAGRKVHPNWQILAFWPTTPCLARPSPRTWSTAGTDGWSTS
ncbi:hypothetical protein ACFQX7_36225 [Luedemannella flava]